MLNQKRNNRIIGGMLWLRMSNESINTVIDLCDLGLNQIDGQVFSSFFLLTDF